MLLMVNVTLPSFYGTNARQFGPGHFLSSLMLPPLHIVRGPLPRAWG